ncbi:MAG: acetolactate decarboxylase [bacterium]|nr:acetolactate decarboxylase [Candidatus Sumerlaeota bacterium]
MPAQSKPYPKLAEVTRNQPVFENRDVKGIVLGFWRPDIAQGINVPGFHAHFLHDVVVIPLWFTINSPVSYILFDIIMCTAIAST